MKTPVSAQAKTPVSAQARSSQFLSLTGAAALGIASVSASVMMGCAYDKETRSAITPMEIKPIGLVTKSAETPEAYYTLGKYYFWQNRAAQAREAFEQALRLRPDSVEIMNGLAAAHDRLGNYAEAQRLYREALAKAPQAAHVWSNYGYSLLLEGRSGEAIAPLEQAVSLDPSDAAARRHLASAREIAPVAQPSSAQKPAAVAASSPIVEIVPATRQVPEAAVIVQAAEKPPASVVRDIVATRGMPTAQAGQQDSPSSVVTVQAKTPPAAPIIQLAAAPSRPVAVLSTSMQEAAQTGFGHARVEISNGNGVTGMARAMRTVLQPHGANIARVTNAKPFNTARTTIFCPAELKDTANAIARFLPAAPTVVIASVTHRNVDIRVVLGADAAQAWNRNDTIKLAALSR